MRIQSKDIPQADRIESVVMTVVAVANGARTDVEIMSNISDLNTSRQGRYYRRAAVVLGLITNERNNAQITPKGQEVARNPSLTNPTLLASVLNLNLYQKLLPYFELHPGGITKDQILDYLQSIADEDIGPSMIPRRISTIIAWIRDLSIIEHVGDKYRLASSIIPKMPVIEFKDIQQPIIPSTGNLQEYQAVERRVSKANEIITIYKKQATLERANTAHAHLINLVAERIKNAGGIPKSNQFIDLATTLDHDFIFEMKSTTESNAKDQVRKGISQLYEYRYLQNKPEANLVLVVENPLTGNDLWMVDYMETDRSIHLIWDGNDKLYGTEKTRDRLPFLGLLP